MSKATKRKHVAREVLEDFVTPTENQQIVKVTAGRGNNLHQVQTPLGETFLASMPTKFRKNVWIKRGDFVVTEPIDEGDKVKAEIVHILYRDQIRQLKKEKLWPLEFESVTDVTVNRNDDDEEDGGESGTPGLLFVNTNRRVHTYDDESSDVSSTDGEN